MDMRFGTCNVRSLYRTGSLKTVANELAKYNLDLIAVQEVSWVEGGSQRAGDYTFCYGNGNANHQLGTSFFTYVEHIKEKQHCVVLAHTAHL